jgi:hypothetical protein
MTPSEKAKALEERFRSDYLHLGHIVAGELLQARIAQELRLARADGIDKGAEIARYWMTSPQKSAAYQAGCRDVETSCFAAAARIRRGEYENPTSEVMGTGTEAKDAPQS